MEEIKATILEVMQELEARRQGVSKDSPEVSLKKIFTKKELGHIKINYLKKGILGIGVDSSAWLYQLNLQKDKLLNKIRKQPGKIKDIRFRLGQIK
jgi:predicted nucleic acid-binding Zn ribbon protein